MNYLSKLVGEIEVHSIDGIKECFLNGVNANDYYNNKPLIYELTSEYLRSPRFKDCVKVFIDYGLIFDDKVLLSVLLDDAQSLENSLKANSEIINNRYSLRCAFTPLDEATLLHICAEFNHVACAKILVEYGADVDAKAGLDANGFGGQTPIFHTVNQIQNQSLDMLNFLLEKSADLKTTIPGLIWGKGYDWETVIPSINPISYAMMGNLPQMHRKERDISGIIALLLKAAYGIDYMLTNVPNKYLQN
ncbi:MAG: ankyrin repeat domain-containing protein [Chitinophagaceae bacterium]